MENGTGHDVAMTDAEPLGDLVALEPRFGAERRNRFDRRKSESENIYDEQMTPTTPNIPAPEPTNDPAEGEGASRSDERSKNDDESVGVPPKSGYHVPPHAIPIRADVRTFDWKKLSRTVGPFDVITMDPPWRLATAQPSRGVALDYVQMPLPEIGNLPVPQLQKAGQWLGIWVINSSYAWTLGLFKAWGYELVDDITWIKCTRHGRLAKGHGYYLQHAKETFLLGRKKPDKNDEGGLPSLSGLPPLGNDVLFALRRAQSQKPEEIYPLLESLAPNGKYLELFARVYNLRNFWVSVGLEL